MTAQTKSQPMKKQLENIDLKADYKPSLKEEYMNLTQLKYFQGKLLEWRDQLVGESEHTLESLKETRLQKPDDTDRAVTESDTNVELRTRERYLKLISKIDKALLKIENGTYGYCDETGEEIGVKRLEARPVANLTVAAQEKHERKKKQMLESADSEDISFA
jgi:DnaK suppressor protein